MDVSFEGRTALVTGAASGLGQAVARLLVDSGARVVGYDLAPITADGVEGHRVDIGDPASIDAALADIDAPVDVLCNIAGGFRMGEAVHETSDATWDFLFDLNARSVLHAVRAVVPHMLERGRGRIVNVGAVSAGRAEPNKGAYNASKTTVIRLTETMAAELRERGINVNCVLPSTLDTPDNRAAMPDADPSRWVPLADLAAVMVFLASDAARSVHGAAVPVTGLG